MNRCLLFALLVLSFAMGCSSPEPEPVVTCPLGSTYAVKVHPDVAVHADDVALALTTWRTQMGDAFSFRVEVTPEARSTYEACTLNVVAADAADGIYAVTPTVVDRTTGVVAGAILALDVRQIGTHGDDRNFMRSLLLHEVGHLVGLEHDEDRAHYTVMWPAITMVDGLGCEDVRRACSKWSCTPRCQGNGWVR